MYHPTDRRSADLSHINRARLASGKPAIAKTVKTDIVCSEIWRTVLCPFCDLQHVHVGRRRGSKISAPCRRGEDSYVVTD